MGAALLLQSCLFQTPGDGDGGSSRDASSDGKADASRRVEDDEKLRSLDAEEAERLCDQLNRKARDCESDDYDIDCEDYYETLEKFPEDCAATAGDARSCADDCGDSDSESCETIISCLVQ